MASPGWIETSRSALERCEKLLRELDAECCEPGRSPRMRALGETLSEARRQLEGIEDTESASATIAVLEDAGGQVGRLQVGCCAPSRLPLYAGILQDLMTAQRKITAFMELGHGGTSASGTSLG